MLVVGEYKFCSKLVNGTPSKLDAKQLRSITYVRVPSVPDKILSQMQFYLLESVRTRN